MINKINLSGEWNFLADEEMIGTENRYFERKPSETINLPATLSIAKKGWINKRREKGTLTDSYAYEGFAWFYKSVYIPDGQKERKFELYLERTRITKVWINGNYAGECNSLCTPHIYDITDFISGNRLDICIMVSNKGYPTKGGHMTSPDTQSNWNGITGEIAVIVSEKAGIRNIQAYPNVKNKSVTLKMEPENITETDVNIWGASSDGRTIDTKLYHVTAENPEITVYLGEDAALWSEYTPYVYTLNVAIPETCDITTVQFGLREFKVEGMNLTINGDRVFLRGKHDGMIFPLTGAAPTSLESWCDILKTAKEWGINHYRFHTCCPPEAAFEAADILGIYMQPELPFWGSVHALDDENCNLFEQEYLIEEGRRILKTFGNHPSFVMMSLGNELWGSPERLNDILGEYKSLDSRHLYTQGSNNFQFYPNIQPNDDFFSGVRLSRDRLIRGSYAMCDAPLGFVQTDEPNTVHSYDKLIFPENIGSESDDNCTEIEIQYGTGVKKVKVNSSAGGLIPDKPIVTHEVGQYFTYPDFDEIDKYTGVLKAYNLELFRNRLLDKDMLSYAEAFHESSGLLAFNCYKLEIEAAMRSEYISGFQLLDLQDFSGQGTALVGMLDTFMEKKKFAEDNDILSLWQGFCSDTAVLAKTESFIVEKGQTLNIPILLRYMRPEKLVGKKIRWSISMMNEKTEFPDSGNCEYTETFGGGRLDVPDGFKGIGKIGDISFTVPETDFFSLRLRIDDVRPEGEIMPSYSMNTYEFEVFEKPEQEFGLFGKSVCGDSTVHIVYNLEEAEKLLANGEKVIYFPVSLKKSVKGFYCTDFWNYPMFRTISESMGKEVPVGTLGLRIDDMHPALLGFLSGTYSTPQWYYIVSHADCAVLDGTPEEFMPIVQMIDNCERNYKLGILYEAKIGSGKLLVCTSRLSEIIERPEVQAFAKSLIEYAHSEYFEPEFETEMNKICLK